MDKKHSNCIIESQREMLSLVSATSSWLERTQFKWDLLVWKSTVFRFGVNTLGNMIKQISADTKLSQLYTNHFVRLTSKTLLGEADLWDCQICHILGHKRSQHAAFATTHYNSWPSRGQLCDCSTLSGARVGEDETELPLQREIQSLNQLN